MTQTSRGISKHVALKFVLFMRVVSLFSDFTYEGARSITGPFLAVLGVSGTAVGIIAGFGELILCVRMIQVSSGVAFCFTFSRSEDTIRPTSRKELNQK